MLQSDWTTLKCSHWCRPLSWVSRGQRSHAYLISFILAVYNHWTGVWTHADCPFTLLRVRPKLFSLFLVELVPWACSNSFRPHSRVIRGQRSYAYLITFNEKIRRSAFEQESNSSLCWSIENKNDILISHGTILSMVLISCQWLMGGMCLPRRSQSKHTGMAGVSVKPGLWTGLDYGLDWTGLWTGLDCGLDWTDQNSRIQTANANKATKACPQLCLKLLSCC